MWFQGGRVGSRRNSTIKWSLNLFTSIFSPISVLCIKPSPSLHFFFLFNILLLFRHTSVYGGKMSFEQHSYWLEGKIEINDIFVPFVFHNEVLTRLVMLVALIIQDTFFCNFSKTSGQMSGIYKDKKHPFIITVYLKEITIHRKLMKLANDHIVTTLQNIIFFLNVFVFLQLIYTYLTNKMMQDIKLLWFFVFWKKVNLCIKEVGTSCFVFILTIQWKCLQ